MTEEDMAGGERAGIGGPAKPGKWSGIPGIGIIGLGNIPCIIGGIGGNPSPGGGGIIPGGKRGKGIPAGGIIPGGNPWIGTPPKGKNGGTPGCGGACPGGGINPRGCISRAI